MTLRRPPEAARLFDENAFAEGLDAVRREGAGDVLKTRTALTRLVKETLDRARGEAEARLKADGRGTACAEALAYAEDMIIRSVYDFARATVFPLSHGEPQAEAMAVIAVGGYGRATLAPGSDIDLLFLISGRQSARMAKVVEFMLYTLWDARQKVGHATRSIDDCLKLARGDNTILTSILEARTICGSEALASELVRRFRQDIVQGGARQFVAEKLAERDQRLAKTQASRYAVEPDVKDGKGGLRDLNTLFWIAKFVFDANSPAELAEKGAFTRSELAKFQKCEDFLWAVRCHLHFIARRGEDKISFDRQEELATRLGYRAGGGLRSVERFMKHYFLIAKEVGDLTRIFCASLEGRQMKDVPMLVRVIGRIMPRASGAIRGVKDFRYEGGRIALSHRDAFQRDPVNLIRLFRVAAQEGAEIHPDALKQVRKSLSLITRAVTEDRTANRLFMEVLTGSDAPETLLRMMNEAGVLGRFIPDFGKIVAMMQFNMYHHFTVDEHLLRAVGILSAIEKGKLAQDHPLSVKLFPTLSASARRALYLATLLHDIAKGRPEHHSLAGEEIARQLGPRLGLTPSETDTVAWLIRQHLVMSETSQMRDLNDFKTILDFAQVVQSPERLKLLLILTVVDIRAVGPGVWNGWKGQLLRTLYAETEPVLTGGHTGVTRKERVEAAQAGFFAHFPDWSDAHKRAVAARHYDAYWLNVPVEKQLRHAALMDKARPRDVVTATFSDAFTAISEVTLYAPDHPRLLALITGACAAAGASIMGAQIFTTADGMALDTILLQREFPSEADEKRRIERVAQTIEKVLRGEIQLRDALKRLPSPKARVMAFTVEPRVIIDNESSNRYTVIEINGLDRIGLLHGLTDCLFRINLNIASAHITTFGEKAVDVFYVTDLTGAKIVSPTRHKQIEQALMQVLAPKAAAA
jgi:[protein-PII] uridylyltransferase